MSRVPVYSLMEIKGKRIALAGNSTSNIVLEALLSKTGLTSNDVVLEYVPPDRQLLGWQAGQYDLVITLEPLASRLESLGGQRIYDSSQFPNRIYDVLVINNKFRWFRGNAIDNLLRGYFRALQHLHINQEDALRRVASWRGLRYGDVRLAVSLWYFPNLNANKRILNSQSSFFKAMKKESAIMSSDGKAITYKSLNVVIESAYMQHLH